MIASTAAVLLGLANTSALSLEAASDAPACCDRSELEARVAKAPRRVRVFIERRRDCDHFTGEEPYDRERAAYLERVISELRCARIGRDEAELRQRYRTDPAILLLCGRR